MVGLFLFFFLPPGKPPFAPDVTQAFRIPLIIAKVLQSTTSMRQWRWAGGDSGAKSVPSLGAASE